MTNDIWNNFCQFNKTFLKIVNVPLNWFNICVIILIKKKGINNELSTIWDVSTFPILILKTIFLH